MNIKLNFYCDYHQMQISLFEKHSSDNINHPKKGKRFTNNDQQIEKERKKERDN